MKCQSDRDWSDSESRRLSGADSARVRRTVTDAQSLTHSHCQPPEGQSHGSHMTGPGFPQFPGEIATRGHDPSRISVSESRSR